MSMNVLSMNENLDILVILSLSCDPHCQLRRFIAIHKNSLFVFFGTLRLKSLLLFGEYSGYISYCVSHKESNTRSVWCECANDKI